MHGSIYQLSIKPIGVEDYAAPVRYYENSHDFADYIGDEKTGMDRVNALDYFANQAEDVFERIDTDVFRYKGADALRRFKRKWAIALQAKTYDLTADNLFKGQALPTIQRIAECTHLKSDIRVDIRDWNECYPYPFGELFEFTQSQLKDGDCLYVGAIIDYHV